MPSRMGLRSCPCSVEQFVQCLLSVSRSCLYRLQRLFDLLSHMKAGDLVRRTGRTWKRLWGGGRDPQYQVRVLLVGKRFTGKTALVYRLKLGAFIPTKPSVGSNTELFALQVQWRPPDTSAEAEQAEEGKGLKSDSLDVESGTSTPLNIAFRLEVCDVAGGDGESLEWHGLQRGCDCVCFALDSTAPLPSFEDARREFLELFYDEHFVLRRKTPFLILATKQDLFNARSAEEVEKLLGLPDDVKRTCKVFGCSTLSGAGLVQVQQWLATVAISGSTANTHWPPLACSASVRRGTSHTWSACDSSSFRERREEMLGTFAGAAPTSSNPGSDQKGSAEADGEFQGQALHSPVFVEQRVSSYPHLLDSL